VGLALRAGKVLGMVAAHSLNIPRIPNERETSLITLVERLRRLGRIGKHQRKRNFSIPGWGSIPQSVQNGQFLSSLAQNVSHVASHADKRNDRLFVHVPS
jgi:hypothetical protein